MVRRLRFKTLIVCQARFAQHCYGPSCLASGSCPQLRSMIIILLLNLVTQPVFSSSWAFVGKLKIDIQVYAKCQNLTFLTTPSTYSSARCRSTISIPVLRISPSPLKLLFPSPPLFCGAFELETTSPFVDGLPLSLCAFTDVF